MPSNMPSMLPNPDPTLQGDSTPNPEPAIQGDSTSNNASRIEEYYLNEESQHTDSHLLEPSPDEDLPDLTPTGDDHDPLPSDFDNTVFIESSTPSHFYNQTAELQPPLPENLEDIFDTESTNSCHDTPAHDPPHPVFTPDDPNQTLIVSRHQAIADHKSPTPPR